MKSKCLSIVFFVVALALAGCSANGVSPDGEARAVAGNPVTDIALLPNRGARWLTQTLQSIPVKKKSK